MSDEQRMDVVLDQFEREAAGLRSRLEASEAHAGVLRAAAVDVIETQEAACAFTIHKTTERVMHDAECCGERTEALRTALAATPSQASAEREALLALEALVRGCHPIPDPNPLGCRECSALAALDAARAAREGR